MNILFLCTGNICRSPMAAAIAREEIVRTGLAGVEVSSAGIAALDGWGATSDATLVAAENGLSLAGHQAQQLTSQLVATVDLVVAMQHEHADYARRLGARQVVTLGRPIRDPYGRGIAAYRETWALLRTLIPALLAERCAEP